MEFIQKHKLIILIVLLVIITGGLVYYFMRKKQVEEKVLKISAAIDSGVGALGLDVDSVLVNIKEDTSFIPLKSDLLSMNSDDEDVIVMAFKNKNKSQIKRMLSVYKNTYNEKFNDHLNDVFSHWYRPYETDSYQMILSAISSAS